jgi:hypothetical protein
VRQPASGIDQRLQGRTGLPRQHRNDGCLLRSWPRFINAIEAFLAPLLFAFAEVQKWYCRRSEEFCLCPSPRFALTIICKSHL